MEYIGDKIDPKQFGAKKKVSTTHYLIEFLSFILYIWDLKENYAVVATLLHFSKAFNRVNHNLSIARLEDWFTPIWLIRVIMGCLSERKL